MKRILYSIFIAAVLTVSCKPADKIKEEGWAPDVRTALNDFLAMYGNPKQPEYVVFDFDNTSCIFDVSEQLVLYQLENMCWAIQPSEFNSVMKLGLEESGDRFYSKIDSLTVMYSNLWNKYGPFTPEGVDEQKRVALKADPEWHDFADRIGGFYLWMQDLYPHPVHNPYLWMMQTWFYGMTSEELYTLARKSDIRYKDVETTEAVWEHFYMPEGIQVTENMRELWRELQAAGIDVWECSASSAEAILAAVDEFGLHDYCKGVLGMTMRRGADGRLNGAYDYASGHGYLALENGGWQEMDSVVGVETAGPGKVSAIENVLCPIYEGRGPLAGFGDSTGDFNFCTEFKSLKLVVCFNRANRKVTDGGALMAEVALYERDFLGYDLKKANKAGDILYVLQGRNENGKRTFSGSNSTYLIGATEPKLLCNEQNEAQLEFFKNTELSVSDIMSGFSIRTEADSNDNPLGFTYGFLKTYSGYKSR